MPRISAYSPSGHWSKSYDAASFSSRHLPRHLPLRLRLLNDTHLVKMGAVDMLVLLLTHPNDFRQLALFWLWHLPKRDLTSPAEFATSGWDRPTMKRCWGLLDETSRSFSTVIKELDGDLARVVRYEFKRLLLMVQVTQRNSYRSACFIWCSEA